ncbi:MAG: NAD(+)/NADH kinase [Candidatus Cryptobacteroides sp.]
MKAYIYIGKEGLEKEGRIIRLVSELEAGGWTVEMVRRGDGIPADTDMLLSVGGDGTFLSASAIAAGLGVPVVGVNLGRLGFLSENRPEDVSRALLEGSYIIEDRTMLDAALLAEGQPTVRMAALNEITVHRSGAAMLGVDVSVDGVMLPTYWADGLVISTSSGSTAYSLSVGGPIVLPQSRVLIISPIAPHNLNIRPLVVPDTARIELSMHSRDGRCTFTADNRTLSVPSDVKVSVAMAQFSLRRVRLNQSDFINALTEKLFWGEDVRNIK